LDDKPGYVVEPALSSSIRFISSANHSLSPFHTFWQARLLFLCIAEFFAGCQRTVVINSGHVPHQSHAE
jgi:hypothetical protein